MRNVILSREKVSKGRGNFMGRGNLIQNSLQLTPFNRSRETETGKERERWNYSETDTMGRIDLPITSLSNSGTN